MSKIASVEKKQTSVRLALPDHDWVQRVAEATGRSFNDVLDQLIGDARTLYTLPPNIRERLEADAKRNSKTGRDYILFLLGQRYEHLFREEILSEHKRR